MYSGLQGTKKQVGNRCEICTGCGRCFGQVMNEKEFHIVTNDMITGATLPLLSNLGKRLVTVDVGTTTIAMICYNQWGQQTDAFLRVNPQAAYGSDVIARITAGRNPLMAAQMKQLVRQCIKEGMAAFQNHFCDGEEPLIVLTGNVTMIYLLMGWDTEELGEAPFTAGHLEGLFDYFEEWQSEVFVFPGLSAFVGGDIVAGIYALDMAQSAKMTLLIDLGTNGEMVLGNKRKLVACATAAGPAFEGGINRGIWGSDLIQLTAKLLEQRMIDESGLLREPYFETGIRIGNIKFTQESVRMLQYAKAAVAVGIENLLKECEVREEEVEQVVLAGGFGYYLSPDAAVRIGLLPRSFGEKTQAGANTALAGAYKLGVKLLTEWQKSREDAEGEKQVSLKDVALRLMREVRPKQVQILNLANTEDFGEQYIKALNFKAAR